MKGGYTFVSPLQEEELSREIAEPRRVAGAEVMRGRLFALAKSG